jgi:hypothetical protein
MMTKAQIKALAEASAKVAEGKTIIEDIMNEHQEDFDAKPEKWQEGEKGAALQEIIDGLQECVDWCDEIDHKLSEYQV